ncbi:hypothetical protein TSA1_37035 [Bradyrhizobium nitroreducens]|uniref:DUF4167 domain-containing protein n=1 Tax=Bradyrhizobium nitroreducens TaxID=709803 RepID=A0A2M6UMF8_9BRAD|nr:MULTISPECIES: DUF4167 domain-containing protein [Bradyrhizobium]PIT05717.1 hypothetical protein TSA1_37035 [Bradyrhizobium nitroreducens]TQF37873.1 hypothetical protein UNPF46_18050 [Bradyrhizobium sp. UNPF46]
MRNGQNKQRMRNRNNNNNNNRRSQNPMTRVYESNGPDIKIRGTASHIAEKYLQLARDARSSGDPVAAENYYQHAEHYFRLIAAAQEQFRQNQQPRGDEPVSSHGDDGEDDGENFSNFGQEPGFVPQPPQQQSFMRDRDGQREHHQRDHQQRDNQQPREHRERDHRPQPQFQPQPQYQPQPANQPQPVIGDAGSVDRLPSFITGPQPQVNVGANGGQAGFEGGAGGGERYPRRRRRPHGPRPEREAAPAASSDEVAPGE